MTMWVSPGLAILAALAGFVAAVLWHRSSKTHLPGHDEVPVAEYETGLHEWARNSSRLNSWAAGWTAVASFLAALSAATSALI